jgi:cytochrome c-type biogenesis protein CcmF
MIRRNRRRYGGYVIHLGVVLIAVGIAGGAFRQTWSGELQPGESFPIADYSITYSAARSFMNDEKMVNMAVMEVTKGGERVGTLTPQRNFHHAQSQPQSEIGLRTTLSEDLYLVLTQMDVSKRVTLRAWVTPLVAWIWLGGLVMALGMLVILFERPLNGRPTVARQPIADKVAVEV